MTAAVVVATMVAFGAAASPVGAQAPDPCTLLTIEDVSTELGLTTSAPLGASQGAVSACLFSGPVSFAVRLESVTDGGARAAAFCTKQAKAQGLRVTKIKKTGKVACYTAGDRLVDDASPQAIIPGLYTLTAFVAGEGKDGVILELRVGGTVSVLQSDQAPSPKKMKQGLVKLGKQAVAAL